MLRLAARSILVAFCVCATLGLVGLGWLLYQPGGGTASSYDAFATAYERDPSHAALYARAYMLLMAVTDGNAQHYVVHRVASVLASASGHPDAAREQERRASQHHLP